MNSIEFWTDKAMKETGEMLENAEYYRSWAKEIQDDARIEGLEEALHMIVNNHSRAWYEHANELSVKLRELTGTSK